MEKYYVIRNSDGDTTIREYTKEGLIEELNDPSSQFIASFIEKITESDTNYWVENGVLIIKGNIITPKAIEVVKTYDI